jgi:ABC-type maltose transport system permease subunit
MIEIVILVFLAIKIGKMAKKKGLKQSAWVTYTVLSWIGGEIIGVIAGFAIFDKTNIVSIMLMGLAGAIGGYFIIKHQLDKVPDNVDEDIDRITVKDLSP